MTTAVAADRLRFRSPPRTEVRFHGTPRGESVSRAERANLPSPVPPGRDHHDVRVDYRLTNRLGEPDVPEEAGPPEEAG